MAVGTSMIRQSYFWRVFNVCPSCATVAMRRAPYVALLWSVTRSRSKPVDNYLLRPADARWFVVIHNFSDILINSIHLKFRYSEKATKIWPIFHFFLTLKVKDGTHVWWPSQNTSLKMTSFPKDFFSLVDI